jgi:hypothetical protein
VSVYIYIDTPLTPIIYLTIYEYDSCHSIYRDRDGFIFMPQRI